MKIREFVKRITAAFIAAVVICSSVSTEPVSYAADKGTTYVVQQDVYYTKDNCVVYAEPTYTSTVLTTIGANIPVQVAGYYTNGWYRINIGVIAYVKMDSLTTAGAIGLPTNADSQVADAQKTAVELGYEFVYLKLNKEKKIKKDVFNSYIGKKVILYAKINDELGVSFKMLYNDKVNNDIDLNYTVSSQSISGGRDITYTLSNPTALFGQIAIFQFKVGYDKRVTIKPYDLDLNVPVEMNDYLTEFSEFAYAPVTQVASMQIIEREMMESLTEEQRTIMADHRKGIKYLCDDKSEYKDTITSRLRKDTEYVDYKY